MPEGDRAYQVSTFLALRRNVVRAKRFARRGGHRMSEREHRSARFAEIDPPNLAASYQSVLRADLRTMALLRFRNAAAAPSSPG